MNKKSQKTDEIKREIRQLRRMLKSSQEDLNCTDDRFETWLINSDITSFKNRLGWLYLDCGKYEEGLALYHSRSWRTHGEEKYTGISRALIDMQYYNDARRLLERGLKRFRKSPCLLIAMGLLNYRAGYSFDALKCFEQALKYAPDDRHALYDKALMLNNLGCHEEALSILCEIVQKYPDAPEYLTEAGYAYIKIGIPEEALRYYTRAKDLGYKHPTVYGGIYSIYRDLGMKNEAFEMATEGLRKLPKGHPGLYQNMAEAYRDRGWLEETGDILRKGLKTFPEDEELKEMLADIEDEIDNPDKGNKPPVLGLLLLLPAIINRLKKKR